MIASLYQSPADPLSHLVKLSILYDCFNQVDATLSFTGDKFFQFFMIASLFEATAPRVFSFTLSILYDCFKPPWEAGSLRLGGSFQFFMIASRFKDFAEARKHIDSFNSL